MHIKMIRPERNRFRGDVPVQSDAKNSQAAQVDYMCFGMRCRTDQLENPLIFQVCAFAIRAGIVAGVDQDVECLGIGVNLLNGYSRQGRKNSLSIPLVFLRRLKNGRFTAHYFPHKWFKDFLSLYQRVRKRKTAPSMPGYERADAFFLVLSGKQAFIFKDTPGLDSATFVEGSGNRYV